MQRFSILVVFSFACLRGVTQKDRKTVGQFWWRNHTGQSWRTSPDDFGKSGAVVPQSRRDQDTDLDSDCVRCIGGVALLISWLSDFLILIFREDIHVWINCRLEQRERYWGRGTFSRLGADFTMSGVGQLFSFPVSRACYVSFVFFLQAFSWPLKHMLRSTHLSRSAFAGRQMVILQTQSSAWQPSRLGKGAGKLGTLRTFVYSLSLCFSCFADSFKACALLEEPSLQMAALEVTSIWIPLLASLPSKQCSNVKLFSTWHITFHSNIARRAILLLEKRHALHSALEKLPTVECAAAYSLPQVMQLGLDFENEATRVHRKHWNDVWTYIGSAHTQTRMGISQTHPSPIVVQGFTQNFLLSSVWAGRVQKSLWWFVGQERGRGVQFWCLCFCTQLHGFASGSQDGSRKAGCTGRAWTYSRKRV